MPPDADKNNTVVHEDDEATTTTTTLVHKTSTQLKGNEICVDGIIYSLDGFDHPGGGQIHIFGGNDVTVQYKMIHPHHVGNSKLNHKLKVVGRMTDYNCDYEFGTPFEKELKRQVFQVVRRGKEVATFGFWFRVLVYVSIYFTLMYTWVFYTTSVPIAILFGMSQALVGLNVQHDANHGAISSKNHVVNDVLGIFADLIGYSKWLWIQQHWTHHAYTNNVERDPDSTAGEPIMVFDSSRRPKGRWKHYRFQALYFLPSFCLYWASAVFNFVQVWKLDHDGVTSVKFTNDYIQSKRNYAIALRLVYLYIHVVTPFLQPDVAWQTSLFHLLVMGVAGSLTLAIPFSVSHNFVGANREPTTTTSEKTDWYKSQVETSCTYGGKVAGYLTGGLNFQIEHHLFPRMNSAWYPTIAPIVRRVCETHNVTYTYYPTFGHNLLSTISYMHQVGNAKEKQ